PSWSDSWSKYFKHQIVWSKLQMSWSAYQTKVHSFQPFTPTKMPCTHVLMASLPSAQGSVRPKIPSIVAKDSLTASDGQSLPATDVSISMETLSVPARESSTPAKMQWMADGKATMFAKIEPRGE